MIQLTMTLASSINQICFHYFIPFSSSLRCCTSFSRRKGVSPSLQYISFCHCSPPPSQYHQSDLHPFPRNNAICPTCLVVPTCIYESPFPINLHTPKNILRICYPPPVRRIPRIADVDPATFVCTSHSTLACCCTSTTSVISTKVESTW